MALNETKETVRLSGRSRCAAYRQSGESHTEQKGSFKEVKIGERERRGKGRHFLINEISIHY